MKKCPFRKQTFAVAGYNTGSGYPVDWRINEEFENCVEEKCMMYYNGYCYIHTAPERTFEVSDVFKTQLP